MLNINVTVKDYIRNLELQIFCISVFAYAHGKVKRRKTKKTVAEIYPFVGLIFSILRYVLDTNLYFWCKDDYVTT